MISTKIVEEINNMWNRGGGVFLLWKKNKIYKIHDHHKHLNPEDGLLVLLGSCLEADFKKYFPNPRPSVKDPKNLISYAYYRIENI